MPAGKSEEGKYIEAKSPGSFSLRAFVSPWSAIIMALKK
jgi:hypothetical protein